MSQITHDVHAPVLLEEMLRLLAPTKPNSIFFDGTVGAGGHLLAYGKQYPDSVLCGVDADGEAVQRSALRLSKENVEATVVKANFSDIETALEMFQVADCNVTGFDRVLLDLGWGAHHLSSGRGFSFDVHEPLVMTYDDSEDVTLTADALINTLSVEKLSDIIFHYGEERHARAIAQAIVDERSKRQIRYADELAAIIEKQVPRKGKLHPATKTFQALRIAVNDELEVLSKGIDVLTKHLNIGGRLGIISFHSIEDRIVKHHFRMLQNDNKVKVLTKKPVIATQNELHINRRARSAKLRVIEKV